MPAAAAPATVRPVIFLPVGTSVFVDVTGHASLEDGTYPGVIQSTTLSGRVTVRTRPTGRVVTVAQDALTVRHSYAGAYRVNPSDDTSTFGGRCTCGGWQTANHEDAASVSAAYAVHAS